MRCSEHPHPDKVAHNPAYPQLEFPAPLQTPIPVFSPHSQVNTFPCVHAGFPMCCASPMPHPAMSRARLCPLSHILHHGAVALPSSLLQPHPGRPQTRLMAQTGSFSAEQRGQSLLSTLLLPQPKPPLTSGRSWSPSCPQRLLCKAASSSSSRAGLVFAPAEHRRVPITLLLQPARSL